MHSPVQQPRLPHDQPAYWLLVWQCRGTTYRSESQTLARTTQMIAWFSPSISGLAVSWTSICPGAINTAAFTKNSSLNWVSRVMLSGFGQKYFQLRLDRGDQKTDSHFCPNCSSAACRPHSAQNQRHRCFHASELCEPT